MQGFAVKYYLCHNQSVEISRTNHRHRPCRMNAMTGTFATQFLSKPDGVVHGRQHGTAVWLNVTSGEKATYTVTNNTEIHIYGLTEGDKVQAVEEANTQGYQATYTTGLSEGTLTISSDGSEATVTNTKNFTSPTGVILNYGPYILMIALAGSMAAFFFFKRNRKEA